MEDRKTLTGVDIKYVNKHKEILERRLSYLTERYMLRQNSFDGAEIQALKHCIWLLHLELSNGIVLTHEKASRETDGRDTSSQRDYKTSGFILRRKKSDNGVD